MKGKRTGIEFEKHELLITKQDGFFVHHLKKPNTVLDSIKFVNTNGILAVTGDYSNWIFCREFHPSATGYADQYYWKEKLKISSCQEPEKYDSELTEKRIREMLADEENDYSEDDKKYLNELLQRVDDELEYTYFAYREYPTRWDSESVPFVKSIDYHFLAILDGFDEICRRLKEESIVHENILRPKTRGELLNALKDKIKCEVVATNEEFTSICLSGWLNFTKFKTYKSLNEGWVIFEAI